MYHRFGEDRYPTTSVTKEQFHSHINYIIENKEDLLFKASEVPGIVYEALDEIRSYSKNRQVDRNKIESLEDQLSNQKYLIRVIGIVIIVSAAVVIMIS